jgi:RNA polymerase sigma-70 factor (ECF subfamily)
MSDERPTPTPDAPRALDVEKVCAENTRNIVKWLLWRGIRHAEVGDAAQEVFQAVLRSWDTFDPAKGPVQGWLYGVTRNIARDYRRRERRHLHALLSENEDEMAPSSTPENIVKQKRDSEFLWSVIEKMEEGRREVVIAHLNGLTVEATATALGIPLGTAATRLRAAKVTLQEAFIARDQARARRGVLPLLPAIDVLLAAERARIDAVPADAVAEAQAALDQTLSDLGRGPLSGVRDAPSREKGGDPEQQRIARLLRRLRPFLTSSVLVALAVVGPWQDQTPGAAAAATPSITREITAAVVAPVSGRPAEDSAAQAAAPRARSTPTLMQPVAGAYVGKRSEAPPSSSPHSSSSLSREKMEAVIRAMRRGDPSASSAMGDSSDELSPARRLLQRRPGRE